MTSDDTDGANSGVDVDAELESVEEFIRRVQAGEVSTSQAMAEFRDVHRPAIARLRDELDRFRELLAEDVDQGGDDRP